MSNSDSFYDDLFAGIEEEVEKQMGPTKGKRRTTPAQAPASAPADDSSTSRTTNYLDVSDDFVRVFDMVANDKGSSGATPTSSEKSRSTETPATLNRTWVNPAQKSSTPSQGKDPQPSPNKTWVNPSAPKGAAPAPATNKTWVNPASQGKSARPVASTMVNPAPQKAASSTMVNPKQSFPADDGNNVSVNPGAELNLPVGTELLNDSHTAQYTVLSRLGKASDNGESDVFVCSRDDKPYAVKIFRRAMHIKPELIEKLKGINSDLVAKIIDFGTYQGRYFEVYEYYNAGSLADDLKKRTFSYQELKNVIIPSLNEGLHALHQAEILHRDIKPSNILWRDRSKKSIVLIDFGLSSVVRNKSLSIVVSQTGFTMIYAAPEVINGVYFDESDYYSMGIVLYELFCGKTPFSSDREAYVSKITKPSNMPDDLYNLILGLTYHDIVQRNEIGNPNRRWTYEEVNDWLNGKPHPVPGSVNGNLSNSQFNDRTIDPKISFCEHTFDDIDALCRAMGSDWESGLQFLMRGDLVNRLSSARGNNAGNQQLWLSQIQDVLNSSSYRSADQRLFRVINLLSPNPNYIPCPLGCFDSVEDLGLSLLISIDNDNPRVRVAAANTVRLLVGSQFLTEFMKRNKAKQYAIDHMSELDKTPTDYLEKHLPTISYELAYLLSDFAELDVGLPNHTVFRSVDEVKSFLSKIAKDDYKELYRICGYFLDGSHTMKPQVYGWMRNQGVDVSDFNV